MPNIAIAALDIGTSQIKLGVFCPRLSDQITLLGSHKNELTFGSGGEVKSDYRHTQEKAFDLFASLGVFLKKNRVERLFLGLCSHVSSLLEWKRREVAPVNNLFPIWLDSTCSRQARKTFELTSQQEGKDGMGSFLPAGTNWLLTKLVNESERGFSKESVFLQAGDAIFASLTGKYATHFSAQVSMVHQTKKEYVGRFLEYLGLANDQLPQIRDGQSTPVLPQVKARFHFPEESHAFPALADFYASFAGLRLRNREAFVLGNTSEIAGFFSTEEPPRSERFVNVILDDGYVQYGSTNSGGNIISWFFENLLNQPVEPNTLSELMGQAAKLAPGDCPVFLPYLEGERAPFWNSKLTAAFLELRSVHTRAHLFRSLMESVAFARRQTFEVMGRTNVLGVKMGGGSTQNQLWNTIRASVMDTPILISEEKELAIIGVTDDIVENLASDCRIEKPANRYNTINPDKMLVDAYHDKYRTFLRYQQLLNIKHE